MVTIWYRLLEVILWNNHTKLYPSEWSQELYTALKDLADRDCRSVPSYIRKLLREHIRRLPPEE